MLFQLPPATEQAYSQDKVQLSGAAPRIPLWQEAPLISAGRSFVLVGASSAERLIPLEQTRRMTFGS
jgi:hypothetical protein